MLWPTWHNYTILYKYVFIPYIFKKNSGVEFLIVFFNENPQQTLYIIAIYKPPQMNVNFFIYILENIVMKILTNCPTIIIEDFNINLFTNTIESSTLKNYMNTHNFHITLIESMTLNNTQIDHIWTNAPTHQCFNGSTQGY